MTPFGETLRRFMNQVGIGAKNLSKLTGIPKPQIDSWLREEVRHPRRWPPLLTIAHVLRLSSEDADTLLRSAGYPTIAELVAQLAVDHPDRRHLQPWVGIIPHSPISHHQLRAPIGDFVGRTTEVDQLITILTRSTETGGIATITGVQGMGGIGKTELAYVVANQVQPAFPDAQIVLTLQGVSANPLSPEQALQTILHTFAPGAKLPEDLSALEILYRTQLYAKRVLILADDAHSAIQVQPLLPPPGCALLITSRQRLALPAMTTINLELLSEDESTQLLCTVCPRLTVEEARALARACGYLPLALRASGSLLHITPALTVTDYLGKLADMRQRLSHLRTFDDSQLDVEASLRLSYVMLGDDAKQVFRQLGVIAADFATELAQAVIEVCNNQDITLVLHHLLRRNLVMYDMVHKRWQLHDLMRDLAQQQLERQETETVQLRYATVAVQIAQNIQEQYLAGGDAILVALSRFDTERPHIDAARRYAYLHMETPAGDQMFLNVALATRYIGDLRYNRRHELIPQWEGVRTAAQRLNDRREEARALSYLGTAYDELGETPKAINYHKQHLTIARERGDHRSEGIALGNLGCAYGALDEIPKAISYFKQTLAITRDIGDHLNEGHTLGNLGNAYALLRELPKAISYFEQRLTIARNIGDRQGEAIGLTNLGNAYTDLGATERAIESYDESLSIIRMIGDQRLEAYTLSYLTRAQTMHGSILQAMATFTQALTLLREIGDRLGEAEAHWRFALALAHQGELEQALPLLRTAVMYEQEIGHAKAEEHAALLARLEAGEELPPELHVSTDQRAIVDESDGSTGDKA
jgi:tetratricopeptide (TPR) repeat protein